MSGYPPVRDKGSRSDHGSGAYHDGGDFPLPQPSIGLTETQKNILGFGYETPEGVQGIANTSHVAIEPRMSFSFPRMSPRLATAIREPFSGISTLLIGSSTIRDFPSNSDVLRDEEGVPKDGLYPEGSAQHAISQAVRFRLPTKQFGFPLAEDSMIDPSLRAYRHPSNPYKATGRKEVHKKIARAKAALKKLVARRNPVVYGKFKASEAQVSTMLRMNRERIAKKAAV